VKILLLRKSLSWRREAFFLSFAVVLLLVVFGISALANDREPFPPITPDSERVAPANPAFIEKCLANSASLIAKGGWRLGKQLLTESNTWGSIWRADFEIPGSTTTLVNRLVCWQEANGDKLKLMFAIGQSVPPL
jgi:hypothetical protein